MRTALSGLDILQRFIIHLENAKKHLCNSNMRNSGDHLESDLNMVSLQKSETNTLTAFFSYETITTLLIGIFTLKCSKSRIFRSQSFDVSSSILNAVFLKRSFVKWGFQLNMQQVIDASSLPSVRLLNLVSFNSAIHENLT
jgi:Cu/Ag efflux pump CusA